MASLFAPDGSYLGPLPCWLRIEPVPAYRFIQIHLPTHMPIPAEGGGLPENHVHLRTLNIEVGQHRNGEWKFRLADQESFDAYSEYVFVPTPEEPSK
jgi:hypothetical protein